MAAHYKYQDIRLNGEPITLSKLQDKFGATSHLFKKFALNGRVDINDDSITWKPYKLTRTYMVDAERFDLIEDAFDYIDEIDGTTYRPKFYRFYDNECLYKGVKITQEVTLTPIEIIPRDDYTNRRLISEYGKPVAHTFELYELGDQKIILRKDKHGELVKSYSFERGAKYLQV